MQLSLEQGLASRESFTEIGFQFQLNNGGYNYLYLLIGAASFVRAGVPLKHFRQVSQGFIGFVKNRHRGSELTATQAADAAGGRAVHVLHDLEQARFHSPRMASLLIFACQGFS